MLLYAEDDDADTLDSFTQTNSSPLFRLVVLRAEIGKVMGSAMKALARHGEFRAWIDAKAFIPQNCLWECYLSGPEWSSGPEKRRA